jgi:osmotically-inducible protein OsmY
MGCAGVVVGAGATATTAALQERGLKGAATDTKIYAEIIDLWLKDSLELFRKVGLEIHEGRVLLTGSVPKPENRIRAVQLSWQAGGVKEVINEIAIADEASLMDRATDFWISTQLSTKLMFDQQVSSINYNVDTVNGVVYLLGVAQNQMELDHVIDLARNLRNVRRVISHVRLKDHPERRR